MNQKLGLRLAIGICAVILCLQNGVLQLFARALCQEEVLSALLFLQTGRVFQHSSPTPQTLPDQTQPTTVPPSQPTIPPTQPPATPVFSSDDLVELQYACDYRPDLLTLLTNPLRWSLRDDAPTVLIIHSHATEGYAGTKNYHALDQQENMIAIGSEIARVLEAGGIRVLHDKTYHDHPNYNESYASARSTICRYLEEYPSIQMVLDIHRDASDAPSGQLTTSATVGGQKSAQLMMVVGTDARGNYHPGWQNNLSLALKLSALLEQENPGICRPINLRSERFNMDLTAGSMLVEVGAAGNTLEEAKIAANALAQAILALADGA